MKPKFITAKIIVILSIIISISCSNSANSKISEKELELQKRELDLKQKELDLKEKELALKDSISATNIPKPTHIVTPPLTVPKPLTGSKPTFDDTQFLGKWSYNKGADLMEISKNGNAYKVIWKSDTDMYEPHEIVCTLIDRNLIGDYYGDKKNVKVKIVDSKRISLTIDPFGEFEPISNQPFSKTN